MRTSSSFGPTTRTAESAKSAKSRLSAELALNLGLPFSNVSSSQPSLLLHLDNITANMGNGTSCPRVMDKGIPSKKGRPIRTQFARPWLEPSALTANSATQPATSTGNPPTLRDWYRLVADCWDQKLQSIVGQIGRTLLCLVPSTSLGRQRGLP